MTKKDRGGRMEVALSTRGRRSGGGTEREWRECERRKPEARLRSVDGVGKCGVRILSPWNLFFTVTTETRGTRVCRVTCTFN